MRKRLFQYFFRLEYLIASIVVMIMVQAMLVISDNLPETDDTSFLNPILDRIDFLNIADVSLDAIFAVKYAEFPDPRIKVVNVGEVAPTPDGMIALLLRKLHALGARVIGVDVILDELHFERFPPERQLEIDALIDALHEVPDVVVVSGFDERTMRPAFRLDKRVLSSGAPQGFVNLTPDGDDVVRRFLPRATVEGEEWLSLPVRMLSIAQPDAVTELLRLPAEEQIIYYTGTYEQFDSVPIEDVVFGTMYDGDFFKDAIVLVGFVNEGGLFYLGDTHKTPMGKKIGIEGPDMPGVLIHANVINMLLAGKFITPVPAWGDWLLVFLLAYVSIAIYRVLRTKPTSRLQVGVLITSMLFTEAVIVFFLPLISFFYFDLKISYHLMATAAFLFIPANALTIWVHFRLLEWRVRREFAGSANPLAGVLVRAFRDDEAFPARTRLVHSGVVLPQFAWALRLAEARAAGGTVTADDLLPGMEAWEARVPEIAWSCAGNGKQERELRYLFRNLAGSKDEKLRDSHMREMFFITELRGFNEFVSFDEWELLLPHILRLWRSVLRGYLSCFLIGREDDGSIRVPDGEVSELHAEISQVMGEQNPGLFGTLPGSFTVSQPSFPAVVRLSPFCEWTECKLHRKRELFVFAGFLRRQHGIPRIPAYFGPTPNCEAALSERTIEELREFKNQAIIIEE
jgi:CHASE2 domain-containing sensor protein